MQTVPFNTNQASDVNIYLWHLSKTIKNLLIKNRYQNTCVDQIVKELTELGIEKPNLSITQKAQLSLSH